MVDTFSFEAAVYCFNNIIHSLNNYLNYVHEVTNSIPNIESLDTIMQ